jgi:excisionase family DNA binding protein
VATSNLPEFLTTHELAALLRVKERKVYELAAAGEIPCRRVTGKLLFPRLEIESWIAGHTGGGPDPIRQFARPNVVAGSHDPLLEWALRESRSGLAALMDGSLDGLRRLQQGEAIAGGVHIIESKTGGWNRSHIEQFLKNEAVVVFEWAWRDQGMLVAAGNPFGVRRLADMKGRRFMPRQTEAGTYVLFEELLKQAGMSTSDLVLVQPPARSQADMALAVAEGKADGGIGLACMAHQFKVEFVPLMRERFDLVVFRRAYFEEPFQRLLAFCRSQAFAAHAAELGGYDISGFGTIQFNGP